MEEDVVIDTNVFLHTNNNGVKYCDSAKSVLEYIKNQKIEFCIDDGFSPKESENRSWIGSEYYRLISPGTWGYHYLNSILLNNPSKAVDKRKYQKIKKQLRRSIGDPCDVVFVIAAIGSNSKELISNDFTDFRRNIRKEIKRNFNTEIICTIDKIAKYAKK